MVRPAAKREAVAHLRNEFQMSERRACTVVAVDRALIRYQSVRPDDGALRARLRGLAQERRRFGYRRLFILLRRDGEPSGISCIYREEGLAVRRRRTRRKAIGTRAPILVEAKPNARWSLDFVHDQLDNGRRFRVLNIVDDVTRECLAAVAGTQPDLGLPGDVADGLGQAFIAVVQFAADSGLHAIGPGAFDQRSSGQGIAGLGDAAPPHGGAAGMLRRHLPEIGHQLAWGVEAGEVADLGGDGDRHDEGDAAHGLQGLDHRRHRPTRRQVLDLLGQAGDPRLGIGDRVDVVLQHHLLDGMVEAHRGQPAPM
jgi:hypothetical protein